MRPWALLAVLALCASQAAAQDGCWILCSEEVDLAGPEAAARLEGWLGASLPPGATVERLHEEGFQDTLVDARLEADAAGLAAVLAALGLTIGDLRPVVASADPAAASGRDVAARAGAKTAEGSLPTLPFATVWAAPAEGRPGRWTIHLTAFQT